MRRAPGLQGLPVPAEYGGAGVQTTLLRVTEWLARREILYPVPAAFNTETKVVYRDLALD